MSATLASSLRHLSAVERALAPGAVLFHQGDPVRAMHLVLAGAVHLVRHQADGAALILQRAGEGAVLAEASLYAARYHCDAIAAAPARLLVIPRPVLRQHLAADPTLAESWASHLAGQVQAARLRAEILSLRTVAARLDAWSATHGGELPPRGQWKALAAELGVSPEALYRELAARRA